MYNKGFYTVSNNELLITELCSLKIRKIVFIGIRNYWEAKYSDLIDALTDYNIKIIMSYRKGYYNNIDYYDDDDLY